MSVSRWLPGKQSAVRNQGTRSQFPMIQTRFVFAWNPKAWRHKEWCHSLWRHVPPSPRSPPRGGIASHRARSLLVAQKAGRSSNVNSLTLCNKHIMQITSQKDLKLSLLKWNFTSETPSQSNCHDLTKVSRCFCTKRCSKLAVCTFVDAVRDAQGVGWPRSNAAVFCYRQDACTSKQTGG